MVNNVTMVGRLTGNPTIEEMEDGRKVTTIILAVSRNFKNEQGEYETDFIPCTLWNSVASNATEYCRAGDVIGVKGRIESNKDKVYVVAERVTFLSSSKKGNE